MLAALSTADFVDRLIYGENLEVLQRFITDETVDLVYLDPPFSSNREYSMIFRDESGRKSDAQLASFEESWHWGPTPERHYEYLTNGVLHGGRVPHGVSSLIGALRDSIRPSPMLAYIVEMTTRLVELHRVLKPTGSLYLHCDPTASHYLRIVLDAVFGPENYRNEISWRRSNPKTHATVNFPTVTDTILRYSKSDSWTFHPQFEKHDPSYVAKAYRYADAKGRYRLLPLLNPNRDRPNLTYEFMGVTRVWRWSRERMEAALAAGMIVQSKPGAVPNYKKYLTDSQGRTVTNLWTDIERPAPKERLPYPTQKPLALLARIIAASTNEGDLVLDPFCGCGAAIEAAQAAGRHWIGIDSANHAVEVIRKRMEAVGTHVQVFDWPTEVEGVRRMVEAPGGRHRFEGWALTRLNAQPVREYGGKGADQGIDGRIPFTLPNGRVEKIIVSVKSGHIGPSALRDLKGTVTREKAAMGVLLTLQEPTDPMRREAAEGFYRVPGGASYPKIVIATVADLFAGRMPDLPSRHGVQLEAWQQLPTASRGVTLRPMRIRQEPAALAPTMVDRGAAVRDGYADMTSREARRSPQGSS